MSLNLVEVVLLVVKKKCCKGTCVILFSLVSFCFFFMSSVIASEETDPSTIIIDKSDVVRDVSISVGDMSDPINERYKRIVGEGLSRYVKKCIDMYIGNYLDMASIGILSSTDIQEDKSTTVASMGCEGIAPSGMEHYRLDKKDWSSKEAYFNTVNTNGAYHKFRGVPCKTYWGLPYKMYCGHSLSGVSKIVCLLPRSIESVASVQYIFDKAICDNYCPSGTEKGVAVTFVFVNVALLTDMIKSLFATDDNMIFTGILGPDTNSHNEVILESITTKLGEENVGVVTKLLLESDSSYEQDVRKLRRFLSGITMGYLNEFHTQYRQKILKDDFIAYSMERFPGAPVVLKECDTRAK